MIITCRDERDNTLVDIEIVKGKGNNYSKLNIKINLRHFNNKMENLFLSDDRIDFLDTMLYIDERLNNFMFNKFGFKDYKGAIEYLNGLIDDICKSYGYKKVIN